MTRQWLQGFQNVASRRPAVIGSRSRSDIVRRGVDWTTFKPPAGRTLSLITYAGVLAELDPNSSRRRFLEALDSDLGDMQGGTTKEGIHMGVMSGTLELLQRSTQAAASATACCTSNHG